MQKKILFCASTVSHIKNFHLSYLKAFHEQGYEIWVAANKTESIPYADHVVALPFDKKLVSLHNVKAIFTAGRLLRKQTFDIVSTHTTLSSAVIRAAVILLRKKPTVYCTSHGYLFNENDGFKKWIYLLPEKICSHVTDVLMVMNHEDYDIAVKHKLYRDRLCYINGMGIDLKKFHPVPEEERLALKREQGFSENDFLFLYAAEFSKRKNQRLLITAFAEAAGKHPDMKLLLAGNGLLLDECKELAGRLHMKNNILFLGYVDDMQSLYSLCNACVTTSNIEGLPFNVMEAIACGLPVIASNIKGHRELVKNGKTGYLFEKTNRQQLESQLEKAYSDRKFWMEHSGSVSETMRPFDIAQVLPEIMNIYHLS